MTDRSYIPNYTQDTGWFLGIQVRWTTDNRPRRSPVWADRLLRSCFLFSWFYWLAYLILLYFINFLHSPQSSSSSIRPTKQPRPDPPPGLPRSLQLLAGEIQRSCFLRKPPAMFSFRSATHCVPRHRISNICLEFIVMQSIHISSIMKTRLSPRRATSLGFPSPRASTQYSSYITWCTLHE